VKRRWLAATVTAVLCVGVVVLGLVLMVRCQIESDEQSAEFTPIQDWWETANVETLADDVAAVKRALPGGPSALVGACRQLVADTDVALGVGPPPEGLDPEYEETVDSLHANAERCAGGDLYGVRPIVSHHVQGVVDRYKSLRGDENSRRNDRCG
jgi:hypothetical protein